MATGAATVAEQSGNRPRSAGRRAPRRLALVVVLALAGCGVLGQQSDPPLMVQPPATRPAAPEAPDTSGEALVEFYAGVERDLIASGRMRREALPADVPFTEDDLMRDFVRVALYDEYADVNGRFVRSETPALLRRWDRPVRVGVMTGPSVPPDVAARDRANVAGFTQRLASLTGTDMTMGADEDVNFLVLFMNSAERAAFAERVSARYPDFAPAVMSALHDTPLDTFCTAYAFSDPMRPSVYSAVIILIRAEHPPLTKLSCVNEEMSQAMGLPNDSPDSRPSLYNDNLEFALLTEHDAILLRMLYDSRLQPGMTAAEVRPLLPDITRDAVAAQRGEAQVASSEQAAYVGPAP